MALDDPLLVVSALEVEERLSQLLDGLEPLDPEQVFLQRPDEPFGTTVAFWRTNEGGGTCGAKEADLLLKVAAHVLAAVIVADLQARRDVLTDGTEADPDRLADRLQRLEPVGAVAGMDTDTFG